MVNTRKGSYVPKQSENAPNVITSSAPLVQHARREASSRLQDFLRSEAVPEVCESAALVSPAVHAHRASKATVSDMDSDYQDDSSSTEGVFIPTPEGPRRSPAIPSCHSPSIHPPQSTLHASKPDALIIEFIVNLHDEFNNPSSADYQIVHIRGFKFVISPTVINGFLGNIIDIGCSPSCPTTEVLAAVLSGGTLSTWPVNGILAAVFNVKYLLYQICNDDKVDTGAFIYNQLLRHVGSFGVKIPIALPRLFSSLLLHLNRVVLTATDAPGPEPKTIALSYKLFQGSNVPDIDHDLAARIIISLTAESRALATFITLLSERRLEVDALLQHLKSLGPSTSRQ
ncbi:uncharacterized protein E5676_scaffold945G00130 [Cucumis melo var. makuwa]|uniref:Envelope-like protein n=1 Tax=Cucumis melo var. makuwa TaxID=1194695 RepID=A0A5D3D5H3_CUCMM|nr:uncharacterized protein E6C27_scaffold673G00130 [Cucumis melo var. makuwa]TYK18799.1 uncharacterized protein E5676_scaffold945G00130 [Cucumis melo var. makuwa]